MRFTPYWFYKYISFNNWMQSDIAQYACVRCSTLHRDSVDRVVCLVRHCHLSHSNTLSTRLSGIAIEFLSNNPRFAICQQNLAKVKCLTTSLEAWSVRSYLLLFSICVTTCVLGSDVNNPWLIHSAEQGRHYLSAPPAVPLVIPFTTVSCLATLSKSARALQVWSLLKQIKTHQKTDTHLTPVCDNSGVVLYSDSSPNQWYSSLLVCIQSHDGIDERYHAHFNCP